MPCSHSSFGLGPSAGVACCNPSSRRWSRTCFNGMGTSASIVGQRSCTGHSVSSHSLSSSRRISLMPCLYHTSHQRQYPRAKRRLSVDALFTGIVQGKGRVAAVERRADFSSIQIVLPQGAADAIRIGASVAINGTCLTVTAVEGDTLRFDIIVETLRATNLGSLAENSAVNYERSARVGDEIGGHNVSGHVATTAEVSGVEDSENNRRITFRVPQQWMKYILPKGFVAVDGCSLTVGEVGADWFTVYLIPETLRITVLGDKGVGDTSNIEIDAQTQAIVDTVEKVVRSYLAERPLQHV